MNISNGMNSPLQLLGLISRLSLLGQEYKISKNKIDV